MLLHLCFQKDYALESGFFCFPILCCGVDSHGTGTVGHRARLFFLVRCHVGVSCTAQVSSIREVGIGTEPRSIFASTEQFPRLKRGFLSKFL